MCGYNAPPAPTSSSSTTINFSKRARAPNSGEAKSPNEPARGFVTLYANFMSRYSHPLLPYSITWRPWRCQELFYTAYAGLYQDFRRFLAFLRDFATKIGSFASRPREFVGVIFLCFRLRCILTIPTWRCNISIIEKYIKNTR